MPRKGRSNEEIVHAVHQVEVGEKVTEVCRRLGVSEQTSTAGRSSSRGCACRSCASSDRYATKTASRRGGRRFDARSKPRPGHRLHVDVKFLERIAGTRKRLYQFTAIDVTRQAADPPQVSAL